MPPTRDQLQEFVRQSQQSAAYEASLNTLETPDAPRARADASLRRATDFPLPIWDDTTRQMAQGRQQQQRVADLARRSPTLAPWLADSRNYALAADDLQPLGRVGEAVDGLGRIGLSLVAGGTRGRPSPAADQRRFNERYAVQRVQDIGRRVTRGFGADGIGKFFSNVLASANQGAAGALEGTYDLLTLRTFGVQSPAQRLQDEIRQRGLPANMNDEQRGLLALMGIDPANPMQEADPIRRWLQGVQQQMIASQQANRIETGNPYIDAAIGGLQSVPMQMAALVMAARGDPKQALTMLSTMTGGQAYGEATAAGLPPPQAFVYAVAQGSLEAAGEAFPVIGFVQDVNRGSGFTRTVARQLVTENIGEQFTSHSQDFVRWSQIEANQGKSLQDYFAERPQVALDTFIATTAAAGAQTSISRVIIRAMAQASEAEGARTNAGRVDALMDAAAESRLRSESPPDFQALVERLTEDSPVDNLYIPAAEVRQLFQSPQDMADDAFWGGYIEQLNEAEALGGDVVVPLAAAATHLAGSPQWDALKDHVRTSAGGMSRAEAGEAETAFFDAMRESGEALAAEYEAERQLMEPVEKVYEAMRDKLLLAGFRADVANQLAQQFASRQRVRAERLGRPLTGAEADAVEVRQVLPENIARAISAENTPDAGLRSVIALMRGKKAPRSERARRGPSLIEFLVKRGGIEDIGGELAHMGFGTLGKSFAKKGQKKLIRKRSDNAPQDADGRPMQESMEHSFERALEAAIDAGYFPELDAQNIAEADSVSSLTREALLDAIRDETGGRPRYADDRTSEGDQMRMAAQELYALLDQQGLDPDKASDAEIVRTISQYQAERSAGRGYDQAESAAFKKWFGDSKVVGENGEPLVVYHGGAEIDAFDRSKTADGGFHFGTQAQAQMRAGRGKPMTSAYLTISNPRRSKDMGGNWKAKIASAKAAGHDGIVYLNRYEGLTSDVIERLSANGTLNKLDAMSDADFRRAVPEAEDSWIAFEPSQIKSNTNRGTFDPSDPRILHQSLFDDPDQPQRTMTEAQRAEIEARQLQGKARRGGQESVKDQEGGLFSAERDQDSLFQSYGDGPRARITFTTDGKAVIDLFEARDLSSFIHESGHLYLEELKVDAAIGATLDTPEGQQLAADFEAVKAWFAKEGHAVAGDGTIPTEAHEMWARGFERYAMEGKAPTSALRRAFEAFRSWLLNIYKTADALKAPITPEIRDVMARLLATDTEIASAKVEQAIMLGFTSAKDAGMTDAEFAAYRNEAAAATDDARDTLLQKVMATVRAARTKAFKAQEAEARAEVQEQVDAQPVFKALAMLRQKGGAKLDKQFLLDSYGEDALDRMPRSVPPIYGETGIHPDVLAEEAGFTSGDEMIRALMDHETARKEMKAEGDKRSPRQAAIDEGTAAAMAAEYGDPLRDGSIEEDARAIVHNDKQGEVFAAELRALGRQTGKRPTAYRIAKAWAAERIAAGRVTDVASGAAIQQYARAAAKAGREFEQALAKGERDTAFRHKQSQMLNNALVSAAREAKDRVDVAVRRLGKLAKAKTRASMDQGYLDQIHALLEQVELRPRSQASLDEQQSYEAWAEEQRKAGVDLIAEPDFARSLGTTHWSRLTVEALIGLDETVQQIAHLGRLKQTLLDGQEKRKFEEARDELIASADGAGRGRKITALNDPSRSLPERIKSRIRWADASMIKVEQMVDWLDSGKSNGPWNRMLFKPLADAQGAESDLMRQYTETINAMIKAMPRSQAKDWSRLVDTPDLINRVSPDPAIQGRPWQFGKDQIVMIAMNMGNAGNVQRLLDGYGWAEPQVRAVLDRLMTKQDWDFVQGVWDALETLKAPLFEMERRVNGVAPDEVQATPVETAHGTYRGGYFPAVYDTAYSTSAELQDMEQKVGGGAFFKATTRSGSTKERAAAVKRPMLLNTAVITRHLGEVIHDITHREAVMQVAKILSDQQIRNAVNRRLGPEYIKAMEAWLDDVAKPGSSEARLWAPIQWAGKHLNRGISLAGLGYNVSSALIQPIGMANIIGQIGERANLEGQAIFLAHPKRTYREVTERSAEMRDRFSTMDANIAEMYAAHGGSNLRKIGPNGFVKHAYDGILYMDMLITTGGWIGAFNKGLRDGMTETEATYYADKVIRTSQGAGGAKDKSAIMRAPALIRSFWPFFSYLNALYNQQRDIGRRARNIKSAGDAFEVARRAWWVLVVPPLVEALMRGEGPDEDDEETWAAYLAERVFIGNTGSLPGVGPIASAASSGWGYRASSLQQAGAGAVRGIGDTIAMIDGDEDSEPSGSFIKNIFTTVGIFTALPLAPVGKAAQFTYDVNAGEVAPQDFGEWYEGLTTGRVREEN